MLTNIQYISSQKKFIPRKASKRLKSLISDIFTFLVLHVSDHVGTWKYCAYPRIRGPIAYT